MGWNELCLLSGLRPGGGPSHLLSDYDIDRVVEEIAGEIKAILETTPLDLLSILHKSLTLAASYNLDDSIWKNEKPPGLTEWSYTWVEQQWLLRKQLSNTSPWQCYAAVMLRNRPYQ